MKNCRHEIRILYNIHRAIGEQHSKTRAKTIQSTKFVEANVIHRYYFLYQFAPNEPKLQDVNLKKPPDFILGSAGMAEKLHKRLFIRFYISFYNFVSRKVGIIPFNSYVFTFLIVL
jgi:hypothetical protein